MKRFPWNTVLACALSLAMCAPHVAAQAPWTLSYEGLLTDTGGTPLPDGPYSITFRFYPDRVTGSPSFTEVHPAVQVAQGHFSVAIGSIVPLPTLSDPTWLSVQVNADSVLSPRTLVTASPHALGLRFPQVISESDDGPVLKITNTGTGAAMTALDDVDVGSATQDGELHVYRSGYANPVIVMQKTFSDGGEVRGVSPFNTTSFELEPDGSGTGGRLLLNRDNGMVGFSVEGNWAGTEVPIVGIHGSARSAIFDMTTGGDASVQFPPSSIDALELQDEPGVALYFASSIAVTTLSATGLLTGTITTPAAGYIVAVATMWADMEFSGGGTFTNEIRVQLSHVGSPQGDVLIASNGTAHRIPITVHKIFPVAAGVQTLQISGSRRYDTSAMTLEDARLMLLYVPTFVGGVSEPQPVVDTADHPAHMKHDLEEIEMKRAMLIRQLDETDRQQAARKVSAR